MCNYDDNIEIVTIFAALTLDLRGAAAITKLNKNGNNVKWYNDGGMLTIGYKFELK